jgi:hypothetical protein
MAVQTVERKSTGRLYFDTDDPDTKLPGVTSVIDMKEMAFLRWWYAKEAAKLAVDSLDFVQRMAENDRDGAIAYLAGAAPRYTDTRSKIGSDAHDMFERMIRGEDAGRITSDMVPYRRQFRDFIRTCNPELVYAEDVAWSDTHGYAGSFDAMLRIWLDVNGDVDPMRRPTSTPVFTIDDWKTSKDPHAEVSLQLTAYSRADHIRHADGTRSPMPAIDRGFCLHLTPEQWSLIPAEISDDAFDVFLALLRVYRWDREEQRNALGKPIAGSARKVITGTQRRGK